MDDDFLDTGGERQAQMRNDAIDYAKIYVAAFVHTAAGAKLLADWDRRLLHKRIPVNAPHTEYAATEAVRQFVHEIHAQIALAGTERAG